MREKLVLEFERISVLANRQIYDRVDVQTGVLCREGVTRLLMTGLQGS